MSHSGPVEELLSFCREKGLAKRHASEDERDCYIRAMRAGDNLRCYDCGGSNPSWCSTTYAIFLCLVCSGHHRNKGSHLSFVRSTSLDKFTWEQLLRMALGGNGRCRAFLRATAGSRDGKLDVYSDAALRYKESLDSEMKGLLGETDIPVTNVPSAEAVSKPSLSEDAHLPPPESVTSPVPSPVPSPRSVSSSSHSHPQPRVLPSTRPLISSRPAQKKTRIPMAKSANEQAVPPGPPIYGGRPAGPSTTPSVPALDPRETSQPTIPSNASSSPVPSPIPETSDVPPVRQPYRSPNGGASAISSADFFGHEAFVPTSRQSELQRDENLLTAVNMNDLYMQSQIVAENAKDVASRIAEEGSELVNKGLGWFMNYMGTQ